MMNNNKNELDFNELIQQENEEERSKLDEHLPNHHQKSGYKAISFYHSSGERGLTFLMNMNQIKEETRALDALKQIRLQQVHGYDLKNAKKAMDRLIRTGRVKMVDEIKCNKEQGNYKTVMDVNVNVQSNCCKLQFEAIGRSSVDAEKRCILDLIDKLYTYDLIKEAAIELYCPRRKILNDPVRAIDKKQQAWIDSNIETFNRKMDKIYDEEAIIAKMKTIAIKDPNLIHPEKGEDSHNNFKINNGVDYNDANDDDEDDFYVDI